MAEVPIACLGGEGEYSVCFNHSGSTMTSSARTRQNLWTTPLRHDHHAKPHGETPTPTPKKRVTHGGGDTTPAITPRGHNIPSSTTKVAPTNTNESPIKNYDVESISVVELLERIARLEVVVEEQQRRQSLQDRLVTTWMASHMDKIVEDRIPPRPWATMVNSPILEDQHPQFKLDSAQMDELILETLKVIESEYVTRFETSRLNFMKELEDKFSRHFEARRDETTSFERRMDVVLREALEGIRREWKEELCATQLHNDQMYHSYAEQTKALWESQGRNGNGGVGGGGTSGTLNNPNSFERTMTSVVPSGKQSSQSYGSGKGIGGKSTAAPCLFSVTDLTFLVMMPRPPTAVINILETTTWLLDFPDLPTMRVNAKEAERRLFFFTCGTLNPPTAYPRLEDFFLRTSYAAVMGCCPEAGRMYLWLQDTMFRLNMMRQTDPASHDDVMTTSTGIPNFGGGGEDGESVASSQGPRLPRRGVGIGMGMVGLQHPSNGGECVMDSRGVCACGMVVPEHLRRAVPSSLPQQQQPRRK
eukprot:PhF_6_TR19077/c0_g1_i1/m.28050